MKILVINSGSSSLKFQLINMNDASIIAKGLCERIGIDGKMKFAVAGQNEIENDITLSSHDEAISLVIKALLDKDHGVLDNINEIYAVGHRFVNGGEKFLESVISNPEVIKGLEGAVEYAPLHTPPNVTGIKACTKAMPGIPQCVIFDTSFHQTMPKYAYMYALPYEYYEKYAVRRYGFHGTSHKYVSMRAAEMLGKDIKDLKIVTCHLGNGSSLCAVNHGKCIDTSMGFTPLAGTCMGTRTGDIDPSAVTFVMNKENLTPDEMSDIMNKKSGVLGISGISSDFRDLFAAKREGNKRAELALDMFTYHVKKYIGAYTAAMGGIDALVFTAGIGENTPDIRTAATNGLEYMGINIDQAKNDKARGVESIISPDGADVPVLVIPTNEEYMIAKETLEMVQNSK